MDELHSIRHALRPLRTPTFALVGLLIVSWLSLSSAGHVTIPPAPETMIVERVRIDHVQHTREPAGPSGPSLKTSVGVHLAQSEDWPGITFRFSGAAAGVSIIPPVVFDLYLSSSLKDQADRRRQWPNVFPQLQVHGIAQDGQLLVDPQTAHDRRIDQKGRSAFFGYVSLALALVPGIFLVQEGTNGLGPAGELTGICRCLWSFRPMGSTSPDARRDGTFGGPLRRAPSADFDPLRCGNGQKT